MRRKLNSATIIILFIMMILSSLCVTTQVYAAQDYRYIYNQALQDAMLAEKEEVCDYLAPIDRNNKNLIWQDNRVLVVTWTKHPESYPVGKTVTARWGDTWVTVVPEIKDFVRKNKLSGENALRIEQLLGLPPDSGYKWFAELWVKPEDLFRPSPDPEINDTRADLTLKDSVSQEHRRWFNNTIMSQYFGNKNYPWTRLGYTYDWGNPQSEIGLSEFVIKKGSSVIVNSLCSNEIYMKLAKESGSYSAAPLNQTAIRMLEKRQLLDTVSMPYCRVYMMEK